MPFELRIHFFRVRDRDAFVCQAATTTAARTDLFVLLIICILIIAIIGSFRGALGPTTKPAFCACETCYVPALQARDHKTCDNLLADRTLASTGTLGLRRTTRRGGAMPAYWNAILFNGSQCFPAFSTAFSRLEAPLCSRCP